MFNEDNLDGTFRETEGTGPFRDIRFEACTFDNCSFSNAVFENVSFIDCRFVDSDLSMASVEQSTFNGVQFERCRF